MTTDDSLWEWPTCPLLTFRSMLLLTAIKYSNGLLMLHLRAKKDSAN